MAHQKQRLLFALPVVLQILIVSDFEGLFEEPKQYYNA